MKKEEKEEETVTKKNNRTKEDTGYKVPTIKGVFVNSHLKALRRKKGREALGELEQRYGKPIKFNTLQEVPVREEVEILEHVLDLLTGEAYEGAERSFEAGRLHFRNFADTTYGRMIIKFMAKDFKSAMLKSTDISVYIFKHVKFSTNDLGERAVMLRMENNDYPIDHFKGLFFEWLVTLGYSPDIEATDRGQGTYEYMMKWE